MALQKREDDLALRLAGELQELLHKHAPRSLFDKVFESAGSILSALVIAIAIRTIWFEPYSIPSGSMRPTLKENDYLVVSKTDFGINVPLLPSHFYFDPHLVKRGTTIVFSGEELDIPGVDTVYFGLFPGKKQFVKRLIGKPGDSLYFYGGHVYGVDSRGRDLAELRDPRYCREHIPCIQFDGRVQAKDPFSPVEIRHVNQLVSTFSLTPIGTIAGETIHPATGQPLKHFSDLYGLKNYALCRLLSSKEAETLHPGEKSALEEAPYYLELYHHPSILGAKVEKDLFGRIRPSLKISTSLIPLHDKHLSALSASLSTSRFVVKDGSAKASGRSRSVPLPQVADGTYEIDAGVAYQIHWAGVATRLPADHPLQARPYPLLQTLFNHGVDWEPSFSPPAKLQGIYPSRYAYFRDHELCLFATPIWKQSDPTLTLFLKREYQKQSISPSNRPYFPFDDAGPPLKPDGSIDAEFVRAHGISVPEHSYFVLGDNQPNSGDSRDFGFVPEGNLRGSVSFLFWPPGPRWGRIPQPPIDHFTLPNGVVWIFFLSAYALFRRYKQRQIEKLLNALRELPSP
jgi:signal peptidase I